MLQIHNNAACVTDGWSLQDPWNCWHCSQQALNSLAGSSSLMQLCCCLPCNHGPSDAYIWILYFCFLYRSWTDILNWHSYNDCDKWCLRTGYLFVILVDIFFVGTLTAKYFASINVFGRVFEVLCRLAKLRLPYRSDFKLYKELKCKYVVFY